MQEALISGYVKKETVGWQVGVRDGSRGARVNLLSVYDRVPYYPTRPQIFTKLAKATINELCT